MLSSEENEMMITNINGMIQASAKPPTIRWNMISAGMDTLWSLFLLVFSRLMASPLSLRYQNNEESGSIFLITLFVIMISMNPTVFWNSDAAVLMPIFCEFIRAL